MKIIRHPSGRAYHRSPKVSRPRWNEPLEESLIPGLRRKQTNTTAIGFQLPALQEEDDEE